MPPTARSAPRGGRRGLSVLTAGLVRYFFRRYTIAPVVLAWGAPEILRKGIHMSESTVAAAETVDARVLLDVLSRVKGGDFSARMPLDWIGLQGKVADGFNDVIIANQVLEAELNRVSRVVGKQGELSQRVILG